MGQIQVFGVDAVDLGFGLERVRVKAKGLGIILNGRTIPVQPAQGIEGVGQFHTERSLVHLVGQGEGLFQSRHHFLEVPFLGLELMALFGATHEGFEDQQVKEGQSVS